MSCSVDNISIHDNIVKQDLQNKQHELNILREINLAQVNQDDEAYEFFLQEYMKIPRLVLTDEQKKHPEYREWLTDEQIKSKEYMSRDLDYIIEQN